MKQFYWIRVGALGFVGTFSSDDQSKYSRGVGVLCQTRRGLEVGEVLSAAEQPADDVAGTLVRRLSSADEPHLSRLETKAKSAYRWCEHWLKQHPSSNLLMDVEELFDGKALYFYFMGGPPDNSVPLQAQLRRTYQIDIQFRHYSGTGQAEAETSCCAGSGCCPQPSPEGRDVIVPSGGCQRGNCSECNVSAYCGKRADSA